MSCYVVDASVAVKWYVQEIHSDKAARLAAGGDTLIAPDLLLAEVGNTIWKKVRRGELTELEGETILRALSGAGVLIRSSSHLLIPAFIAAVRVERTVYDCLYLALALQEGCKLVTADRRFYQSLLSGGYGGEAEWIEAVT